MRALSFSFSSLLRMMELYLLSRSSSLTLWAPVAYAWLTLPTAKNSQIKPYQSET